jgi:UTP--glucose-1-phosphate uridylyltransferase
MAVLKAVIPAAGLGTRFLPASKAIPKEMIPVVDKPGIQYAVEEAVRAGIEEIVVVTSPGKDAIKEHFSRSVELERHLEATGKLDHLAEVKRVGEMADIRYVMQDEPLGFGHAVLTAESDVGGNSFVVMVPDEIVPEPREGEGDLLPELIAIHDRLGAGVITVQEVPHEDISSYGSIEPELVEPNVYRIKDMVEKPTPAEAPSDLAARARWLFTAEIFDAIRRTSRGVGGEIQLTDAIRIVAQESAMYAYEYQGAIYDVGRKLDYVKATLELALRRDDLAKPMRDYLSTRTDSVKP